MRFYHIFIYNSIIFKELNIYFFLYLGSQNAIWYNFIIFKGLNNFFIFKGGKM